MESTSSNGGKIWYSRQDRCQSPKHPWTDCHRRRFEMTGFGMNSQRVLAESGYCSYWSAIMIVGRCMMWQSYSLGPRTGYICQIKHDLCRSLSTIALDHCNPLDSQSRYYPLDIRFIRLLVSMVSISLLVSIPFHQIASFNYQFQWYPLGYQSQFFIGPR